ncbi:MAG: hypothetical protein ACRELX_15220, partial [Longimicrobiales bacterium]
MIHNHHAESFNPRPVLGGVSEGEISEQLHRLAPQPIDVPVNRNIPMAASRRPEELGNIHNYDCGADD